MPLTKYMYVENKEIGAVNTINLYMKLDQSERF